MTRGQIVVEVMGGVVTDVYLSDETFGKMVEQNTFDVFLRDHDVMRSEGFKGWETITTWAATAKELAQMQDLDKEEYPPEYEETIQEPEEDPRSEWFDLK